MSSRGWRCSLAPQIHWRKQAAMLTVMLSKRRGVVRKLNREGAVFFESWMFVLHCHDWGSWGLGLPETQPRFACSCAMSLGGNQWDELSNSRDAWMMSQVLPVPIKVQAALDGTINGRSVWFSCYLPGSTERKAARLPVPTLTIRSRTPEIQPFPW